MIRFLALFLLLLVLAISLGPPTVEGDVSFDLSGATKTSYTSFIEQLRKEVSSKEQVLGIPVLPHAASDSLRVVLIHITNYADQTITVAINVTNVYIVAYLVGDISYFFDETPSQAFGLIFKGTTQKTLPYNGNYDKLQTAAGKIRDTIDLGLQALNTAVTNLFYFNYKSTAAALIVLIQSTAEAARFKYIEQQIGKHSTTNFLPDQAITSLENNWAALSKQIQIAQKQGGKFETPVDLKNPKGEPFQVNSTDSNVVKNNIALLLYYKVSTIRMPIAAATDGRDETEAAEMMPTNCGFKMERKSVDNGCGTYVTV